MKKLIFIFISLLSPFCFSQQITKDTYIETEQIAEFPDGGTLNFRKLIEENFRLYKIKTSEDIACEITFIIDRDGSITNIKATGSEKSFNKEAIRAVSKIKTKWIPAKINGQPVRYRMRIPLNISFN